MLPNSVYFHLEPDVVFEDGAAYLAEGLDELGITCRGSRDYWLKTDDDEPLILYAPLESRDWPIIVLTDNAYRYDSIDTAGRYRIRESLPETARLAARCERLVLLNLRDGYSVLGESDPAIQHIFRAKLNFRCIQSLKTIPYVLGAQKRVLELPPRSLESSEDRRVVLDTFGFTHPYQHQARQLFRQRLVPELAAAGIDVVTNQYGSLSEPPVDPRAARWWAASGGKHNTEYYAAIRRFPVHACFCGEMVPSFPADPTSVLAGGRKARLKRFLFHAIDRLTTRPARLIQWDSWRFWETLAAGAVALHFDLEALGARLPVMPRNWVHYVGLDPNSPRASARQLAARWDELPAIASAGHRWFLENYASAPNARRFLNDIGLSSSI